MTDGLNGYGLIVKEKESVLRNMLLYFNMSGAKEEIQDRVDFLASDLGDEYYFIDGSLALTFFKLDYSLGDKITLRYRTHYLERDDIDE